MKKTTIYSMSIIFIFILWLFFYVLVDQPLLMPSPWGVFSSIGWILTTSNTLLALVSTLLRLMLAIGAAVVLGMLFGVIGSRYQHVSLFFRPYITILRTIPVISFVVIVLIVFGFQMTPYIITFLMIFPIVYQAIHDGIKGIDHAYLDVYQLEDDNIFTAVKHCYFPLIKDHITTALLQSAGLGIKVLVMAEYLAQTPNAIGQQIYLSKVNLNYDAVFGWTILLILIAVGIEALVFKYQKNIWDVT
jgi:NitT/TauT family transport system permease protein